jgi:hypothetical protein
LRETRELQAAWVLWALSWDFWIHLRIENKRMYFNKCISFHIGIITNMFRSHSQPSLVCPKERYYSIQQNIGLHRWKPIFRRFSKIMKSAIKCVISVCLALSVRLPAWLLVCMHAWNKSARTEKILMKFYTLRFLEYLPRNLSFFFYSVTRHMYLSDEVPPLCF